jgi:ATP-dependent DNA ligase
VKLAMSVCFAEDDFDLVGIQREPGKPAMAMIAKGGRYVGGASITLNGKMRERLWERVEAMRGKAPKGAKARDAQWLKPVWSGAYASSKSKAGSGMPLSGTGERKSATSRW